MKENHQEDRRKKIVIYPAIQLHPLRIALLLSFVSAGSYGAILFFSKSHSWYRWEVITAFMIMLGLPLAFSFRSVIFLNRVVGPIYRLQKGLLKWQKKEYTQPIHLRQGDFFEDLAVLYNQLSKRWQHYEESQKALEKDLEKFAAELSGEIREKFLQILNHHFPKEKKSHGEF